MNVEGYGVRSPPIFAIEHHLRLARWWRVRSDKGVCQRCFPCQPINCDRRWKASGPFLIGGVSLPLSGPIPWPLAHIGRGGGHSSTPLRRSPRALGWNNIRRRSTLSKLVASADSGLAGVVTARTATAVRGQELAYARASRTAPRHTSGTRSGDEGS